MLPLKQFQLFKATLKCRQCSCNGCDSDMVLTWLSLTFRSLALCNAELSPEWYWQGPVSHAMHGWKG